MYVLYHKIQLDNYIPRFMFFVSVAIVVIDGIRLMLAGEAALQYRAYKTWFQNEA